MPQKISYTTILAFNSKENFLKQLIVRENYDKFNSIKNTINFCENQLDLFSFAVEKHFQGISEIFRSDDKWRRKIAAVHVRVTFNGIILHRNFHYTELMPHGTGR